MAHTIIPDLTAATSSLSPEEKNNIEQKIDYELTNWHYGMLKMGALANIIAGAIFALALYSPLNAKVMWSWYGTMVTLNIINIIWSYCFDAKNITITELKRWRRVFLFIFALICLTWSSTSIVFISENPSHQFPIFIFLLAALVCFSLSTITDFVLAAICISCLLMPAIIFRFYVALHITKFIGKDVLGNLMFSSTLLICWGFMLVACYFGAEMFKKFFWISLANVELNKKLENMNKFLEIRVQQRTLELQNSLQLVTYQATHDLLTDLPNQRLLDQKIEEIIHTAERKNYMFGVIYFFINEIEKINDAYGHEAGDLTIKTIAQRLRAAFPESKEKHQKKSRYFISLSRKDNFILLLEPIFKIEDIKLKINELFSILGQTVRIEGHLLKLTASVGISIYPNEGKDKKTLLKNASNAMLHAKLKGGDSLSSFTPEQTIDFSKQLQMTSMLHDAMANNEFLLYYQPVVNLKTLQIVAVEALVRWYNPSLGFISPADFVPLAETSGIINPLGEWVLRTACKQTKLWHKKGFPKLKVAVNVSSRQLQQPNFTETFTKILAETKLSPKYVELELTESEAFKQDVLPILKLLTEMGFGLSIDDFGTGYSSLTNLQLITINTLKIDKSFVEDVISNKKSQAIVTHTIELAKNMKITVLAEGAETPAQVQFLQEQGCDLVQGFYFSQPQDAETITELLLSTKKVGFQK